MAIIALCLLAVGAGLAYASRRSLIAAWRSRHWPSTAGYITGRVAYEGVTQGLATDGTFAPTQEVFRDVDWVYTYKVAGRWYKSSRFSFSPWGWRQNDRYLEDGAEVKVYYCPTNPSLAVLRPGLLPAPLLGPFLLIGGLIVLIYALVKG